MGKQRGKKQKKPEAETEHKDEKSESSKNYVSAYKRAEQNLARIQQKRKQKAFDRKKTNDDKNRRLEENLSYRKRMNNVLKQRNKKGQPKLNAQMELLLEKIQKKVGSNP